MKKLNYEIKNPPQEEMKTNNHKTSKKGRETQT